MSPLTGMDTLTSSSRRDDVLPISPNPFRVPLPVPSLASTGLDCPMFQMKAFASGFSELSADCAALGLNTGLTSAAATGAAAAGTAGTDAGALLLPLATPLLPLATYASSFVLIFTNCSAVLSASLVMPAMNLPVTGLAIRTIVDTVLLTCDCGQQP